MGIKAEKETAVATRRSMPLSLFFIGVAGVAALLAFASMRSRPSASSSTTVGRQEVTSAPATNVSVDERMERANRDRITIGRALERMAKGDPTGDILIKMYWEESGPAFVAGTKLVGGLLTGKTTPHGFIVIVATPAERRTAMLEVPGGTWYVNRAEKWLIAPPPYTYTEEWAGLAAAHEILHLLQLKRRPELAGAPSMLDPAVLDAEVEAYELQQRLAARHGGEPYRRAFKEILGRDNGYPIGQMLWRISPSDTRALMAAFPPPKSDDERGQRNNVIGLAVNFALADAAGLGIRRKAELVRLIYGNTTLSP